MQRDINYLYDHRSDPAVRSVLDDLVEEQTGRPPTRLGLALWIAADAGADADADDAAAGAAAADAADADADDADAADAAAGAAAADAADADADDADADDADDADADAADARLTKYLTKEPDMRNGLKIIQVPGRYAGWAVTRVGWLRRISGDEWEMIGARTIIRTGSPRPLDSLAADGPRKDHRLTDPAVAPEEIHRLVIRRSLPASVEAWAKHCPRPQNWIDE